MSDSKKSDQKVFTSMEQLEAELFPKKSADFGEELPAKEGAKEADALAKKLIDDLIDQGKQGKG